MARYEYLFLLFAIIAAAAWIVFSGREGYIGNNAMIVARSISVAATIDGRLDSKPPAVGSKVNAGDLLARLRNGRIDRSRLAELETQRDFLHSEIESAREERSGLKAMLKRYETRTSVYSMRITKDLEFKKRQTQYALGAAIEHARLKAAELGRLISLDKKSLVSKAKLDEARAEESIARNDVASLEAQLSRIDLRLRSLAANMMLREDGDTSYWEKTVDSLRMRLFDNKQRISTLEAQLKQVRAQAEVERARLDLNFVEEHRAPFDGVVNAVFTNHGKHVISGTPLLEILDCDHPIVIVPIPEDRFGEFSIGQAATITPLDSDETIKGTVQHISSGPLIGRDTTLAVQQALTVDGSKVIVGIDDRNQLRPSNRPCDAARKAIATIHMRSLFDRLVGVGRIALANINGRAEWQSVVHWFRSLMNGREPSEDRSVAAGSTTDRSRLLLLRSRLPDPTYPDLGPKPARSPGPASPVDRGDLPAVAFGDGAGRGSPPVSSWRDRRIRRDRAALDAN